MADSGQRSDGELEKTGAREPARQFSEWSSADDEISLFDLWDALVRRRWLIIGVAAGVTVLALVYALSQPETYGYRTAIELGIRGDGGEEAPVAFVEPPVAARDKLEQAYVPAARKAVDAPDAPAPEINVRTDDDTATGVFVLRTDANPKVAEQVDNMHRHVADAIESAHEQRLKPVLQRARTRLERAESKLAFIQRDAVERSRIEPRKQAIADAERKFEALQTQYRDDRLALEHDLAAKRRRAGELADRREQLQARLERVDGREVLTKGQLTEVRDLIEQMQSGWAQAAGELKSSADAMTLLTVGSRLDEARTRAANLEERLQVGLPQQRDDLRAKLQDNARARDNVADAIASLENQLATRKERYEREKATAEQALATAQTKLARAQADYENAIAERKRAVNNARAALDQLRPTRSLFVADRSIKPVGASGTLILALGGVLGGMLGVFSGFVAEFLAAARRRREPSPAHQESAIEWRRDQAA